MFARVLSKAAGLFQPVIVTVSYNCSQRVNVQALEEQLDDRLRVWPHMELRLEPAHEPSDYKLSLKIGTNLESLQHVPAYISEIEAHLATISDEYKAVKRQDRVRLLFKEDDNDNENT